MGVYPRVTAGEESLAGGAAGAGSGAAGGDEENA